MKGNGIIEAKAAQAKLIKENHALGVKVGDLLDQNDLQAVEIRRLMKLTSNYGTVCEDCCTSVDKQIGLVKKIRQLKTLNNWLVVAGSVAAIVILCLIMGGK